MKPLVVSRLLFASLVILSGLAPVNAPFADAQLQPTPSPTATSNTVVKSTNVLPQQLSLNEVYAGALHLPGNMLGLVLMDYGHTRVSVLKMPSLTPTSDFQALTRIPLGSTLARADMGVLLSTLRFWTTTGTASVLIHTRLDTNQIIKPNQLHI
jgi:hypothetical protein